MNKEIEILDYDTFKEVVDSLMEKFDSIENLGVEKYEEFEKILMEIVAKYGKVSTDYIDPNLDFYHCLDWDHHLIHGFAIYRPNGVASQLLFDLQDAIIKHNPQVNICVDADDPYGEEILREESVYGLEMHITSERILVAWRNKKTDECIEKIRSLCKKMDITKRCC